MDRKEQFRWLGILAGTIAGLVILFASYFLFYVRNQRNYIINHNFRRLAQLSLQLQSQIENYNNNVLVNIRKIEFNEINSQTKCPPDNSDCYELLIRELIKKRIKLIPGLNLVGNVKVWDVSTETENSSKQEKSVPPVILNGKTIAFHVLGPISFKNAPTGLSDSPFFTDFYLETEFDKLVGPNARKWTDGVFILDKTGEINAYQLEDEISLSQLKKVLKDGKGVPIEEFGGVSDVFDITLSGNDYKLFVYPIQIQIDQSTSEKWIVGSMIPANQFHSESLSISYTVLIVFVLCFLIASLSMPYLKILLMGPGDKLQRGDVRFLAISTFAGSAILTLFICDLVFYQNLERDMDNQLRQFANKIQMNFNDELNQMIQQLDSLARASQSSKDEPKVNILTDTSLDTHVYPYFEMAIWMDSSGMQKSKWTIQQDTTPLINVSEREYFTNVRNGHLVNKGGHRFSLVPIYSRNTGENLVVLSASHPKTDETGENWVSAMDVKLLSLVETVVPINYGYAVLDNEGLVLFHSSSDRNLRENFIKESENNRRLRAALFAHTSSFINSNYMGRGHRLFVTPVAGFPWSLVVFRNKELLRTSNAELLSISLFLFILYSGILLVGIGVVKLNSPKFIKTFIWPDESMIGYYFLLLITYASIGFLFFLTTAFFNSATLFFWILIWPFLFLTITALIFRFGKKKQSDLLHKIMNGNPSWRRRTMFLQGSYLGVLLFVVILTGILPATAIFKIAHDYEMNLFLKYGQLNLVRSFEEREDRLRTDYRDVSLPKQFIENRLKKQSDIYDEFFFNTSIDESKKGSKPVSQQSYWPWGFLSLIRPLYNQHAIETDQLWNDGSSDGAVWWSGTDRLYLKANNRIIQSTVPRFNIFSLLMWWTGLIVLILIFFLLLRFAAKRIFLLGFRMPRALPALDLMPEEIKRNLLVLGPPFAGKTDLIKGKFAVIDIRKLPDDKNWVEVYRGDKLFSTENTIVALDHLEFKMNNFKVNRMKCELLEEFINEGKRVVVISTVYPSYFCFESNAAGQQDTDNAEFPERWANVFSTFSYFPISGWGDSASFQKEISEQQIDKEIRDSLLEECKPTEYLQNIGREILKTDLSNLDKHQLRCEIFENAYSYYQTIWNACSDSEKKTLYDLAEDGLVNVQSAVLNTLIRKGLIVREPNLKLMNHTFRRFILLAGAREKIASRELDNEASAWSMLKVPFSLILLTFAAFLFISQRELFQSATTLIASLSAAVPAVLNLFGTIRVGRSKPSAE